VKEKLTDQLQYHRFPLINTVWLAIKIDITTQTFLELADVKDLIIIAVCIATSTFVYITEAPKPAEVEHDQSHVPN